MNKSLKFSIMLILIILLPLLLVAFVYAAESGGDQSMQIDNQSQVDQP